MKLGLVKYGESWSHQFVERLVQFPSKFPRVGQVFVIKGNTLETNLGIFYLIGV